MKKKLVSTIILNVILVLTLILLIISLVFITKLNYLYGEVGKYQEYIYIPDISQARNYEHLLENLTLPIALISLALAINFIAIIIIDIPILQSIIQMRKLTEEERKQVRTQLKAEKEQEKAIKAEADKQARIAKLEQQLEELKKD